MLKPSCDPVTHESALLATVIERLSSDRITGISPKSKYTLKSPAFCTHPFGEMKEKQMEINSMCGQKRGI